MDNAMMIHVSSRAEGAEVRRNKEANGYKYLGTIKGVNGGYYLCFIKVDK